jgi:acid phosphatase
MTNVNGAGWTIGAVGLAIGLVVGYGAKPDAPRPNPQERGLDANLWMQTAGEYRACCLQTYRFAAERLRDKLKKMTPEGKPPAVVMDLDETVLDNAGYQTWLYEYAQVYTDTSWQDWEKNHAKDVRLVPGAADFIQGAEAVGVTVVYISNRFEKDRQYTIETLGNVKLNTKGIEDRLLLASEEPGGGNKTERRKRVANRYRVLMLFGDNLRDFDEEFKAPPLGADAAEQNKAIAERLAKVDRRRSRWGDDWIILPNPSYGEWPRLIGRRPLANMHRTTMKAP